jgi:tRNA pseudouridine55 synthase
VTPEATRPPADSRARLDGILLVNKPPGISSATAVARVKRTLAADKVGHLGTLDPFAAGLLPLCLEEGTKVAPYLNTADKSYVGVVRLGVTTDTLDVTGTVVESAPPPPLETSEIEMLAREFTGAIDQVPPAFSAIKRGGRRMYELARKGTAPALEPRSVVIHELRLDVVDGERIRMTLKCSKGTYVRALARDLGARLGCGGVLETLVRTGFGPFTLEQAVELDALDARTAAPLLVSLEQALAHLRRFAVDREAAAGLRAGRQKALETLGVARSAGERASIVDPDGRIIAVAADRDGGWQLERVFRPPSSCAP